MGDKSWPEGIRPSGNGIRIRIWRHGKLAYSETVKGDPYTPADLAAAVARREDLMSRKRLNLPLHREDEQARPMFNVVAQDYLDTLEVKRSTMISYFKIMQTFWEPEFRNWPVDEITTAAIKRVIKRWAVSSKTKKNRLIPLRGVLAHAEMNPNPVDAIRLRKHQKPSVERYTKVEQDALMAKLSGQAAVYFALLFGCGLRPGEALALRWEDYQNDELSITKQITRRRLEESTKTSVARKVYVPQWVRPYLSDHSTRFEGGYIFQTTKGGPHLDTDVFNNAWRKAHNACRPKISYRIPYTCRHTRAAELLSMGIHPADASRQMGHSPEMFLRTYAEFMDDRAADQDKRRFDPDHRQNTDKKSGKNGKLQ